MTFSQQPLDVLVYLTIPQTFLYIWFAFLLLGVTPDRLAFRLLKFSLLLSLYLNVSFLALSFPVHLVNGLAAAFIGLRLTFQEFPVRRIAAIFAVFCVTALLSDLAVTAAAARFTGTDMATAATGLDRLLFAWPLLGLAAAANWAMHHNRFYPLPRLVSVLAGARQTPVLYFILLICSQILVMVLFVAVRRPAPDRSYLVLFIAVISAVLVMSFLMLAIAVRTREDAIRRTQAAYASDLHHVISSIRGQRHAFINRIQAMYALLKEDRLEELRAAMESTPGDIKMVKTEEPGQDGSPLAAFIQAKRSLAIVRKIRFEVRIDGVGDALQTVRDTDLVRILGNLTDNAFDETAGLPVIERFVSVRIGREAAALVISVRNSGRGLPDGKPAALFESGFSTKSDGHSGMGLPIVSDLASRYGGTVEASSESGGIVRFTVRLPLSANRRQGESASWSS